jgi:hypothetical protein
MTDEQKFIPCYQKYGRWYYLDNNISMKKCNSWFKTENILDGQKTIYTHLIPYNCDMCPKIVKSLYAKYILMTVFIPTRKKF